MSTLCTYMYIATYLLTSDIYISTSRDQCLDCLSMSTFSSQHQGSLSILCSFKTLKLILVHWVSMSTTYTLVESKSNINMVCIFETRITCSKSIVHRVCMSTTYRLVESKSTLCTHVHCYLLVDK